MTLQWSLVLTFSVSENEGHCILKSYIYIIFQAFEVTLHGLFLLGSAHSFMWKWILVLTGNTLLVAATNNTLIFHINTMIFNINAKVCIVLSLSLIIFLAFCSYFILFQHTNKQYLFTVSYQNIHTTYDVWHYFSLFVFVHQTWSTPSCILHNSIL